MSDPIENTATISSEQLSNLTSQTDEIVKKYESTSEAVQSELTTINNAIETWEKAAPALYAMRKRLTLVQDILSGKRSVDKIISEGEGKTDKVKTEKKKKKTFVKRKSDIITDEVIEKIRDFIAESEDYKKSKEIYQYLRNHELIAEFKGDVPEKTFAIALSRVDQDLIVFNRKPTVAAWGLKDFGSEAHARRKQLKSSVRKEAGTRVFSSAKELAA
jgi:hypothetical protein